MSLLLLKFAGGEMMNNHTSYIGIGSNMGDREEYIRRSLQLLEDDKNIIIGNCSPIYETLPYGDVPQDDFLNMVVQVRTSLLPEELLEVTQGIEQKLERKRTIRWGPRTIDLDILLFDDKIIKLENLMIPHPELTKRLFVIKPLRNINANQTIPGTDQIIDDVYNTFKEHKGVRLWKQNNGAGESGLFEN